jgi:hypothetical protein
MKNGNSLHDSAAVTNRRHYLSISTNGKCRRGQVEIGVERMNETVGEAMPSGPTTMRNERDLLLLEFFFY